MLLRLLTLVALLARGATAKGTVASGSRSSTHSEDSGKEGGGCDCERVLHRCGDVHAEERDEWVTVFNASCANRFALTEWCYGAKEECSDLGFPKEDCKCAEKKGGGGQIAGIVIGSIVAVGIILYCVRGWQIERNNNFTPDNPNIGTPAVPAAMVAPAGPSIPNGSVLQVVVPDGMGPGSVLQVAAPNGQVVQVQVPEGHGPGTMFVVALPGPMQPMQVEATLVG
jgi:hypothetical protein